jgi:hypothetical protein
MFFGTVKQIALANSRICSNTISEVLTGWGSNNWCLGAAGALPIINIKKLVTKNPGPSFFCGNCFFVP